jgi:hypothetical protein
MSIVFFLGGGGCEAERPATITEMAAVNRKTTGFPKGTSK